MGNQNFSCTCCKDKGGHNASEEIEVKKIEKYPVAIHTPKELSDESGDKGYIYVPEEISSIDYYQYSEEIPGKEVKYSLTDQKKAFGNTMSLGTIQEISNSEVNDFFPSHFLDTEELIKGNLTTSENISKVLEMRLSDNFSYGDSDFEKKLSKFK